MSGGEKSGLATGTLLQHLSLFPVEGVILPMEFHQMSSCCGSERFEIHMIPCVDTQSSGKNKKQCSPYKSGCLRSQYRVCGGVEAADIQWREGKKWCSRSHVRSRSEIHRLFTFYVKFFHQPTQDFGVSLITYCDGSTHVFLLSLFIGIMLLYHPYSLFCVESPRSVNAQAVSIFL